METQFTFKFARATTKILKDGSKSVKTKYGYIDTKEDYVTTLHKINMLRETCFSLTPFSEAQAAELPENRDISGGNVVPDGTEINQGLSMIVKHEGQFICIPYDETLKPIAVHTDKDSVFVVAKFMASNVKKIGKTKSGERIMCTPDPIAVYDTRVWKKITGRIKQHIATQARWGTNKPLTIDFTNTPGLTPEHVSLIKDFCQMKRYDNINLIGIVK